MRNVVVKTPARQTFLQMTRHFRPQLFAEPGDDPNGDDPNGGGQGGDPKGGGGSYSQEEVDKLLEEQKKAIEENFDKKMGQKFAEWQKKQAAAVDEAKKLEQMTAEEKNAAEIKELKDKLSGYEKSAALSEMTKQARAILHDSGINISDNLLSHLVTEDAETTSAAVKEFTELFREEVNKAVKEAVKGEAPKKGGGASITKEEIMKIKNKKERQEAIRQHPDLFKK